MRVAHDWNLLLTDATADFADLAAEADLDAFVPDCPGWTVASLVVHLGGIHQWARHAVVEGNPDGRPEPAPDDGALDGWYLTHAAALQVELSDPDRPAWVFGPGDGTAGWWARRQVHETRMHTRDLLVALDRTDEWSLDPALAWDGVDEVATMFYPRQVQLGRCEPLPGTLRLVATDLPGASAILIGDAEPAVEVSAPAVDLLLMLWHRRGCDVPEAAPLLALPFAP